MNLQDDARNSATAAALGAAATNVQISYAKMLVAGTPSPVTIANLLTNQLNNATMFYTTVGDYTVTYQAGTPAVSNVLITVVAPSGKIGSPATKQVEVVF